MTDSNAAASGGPGAPSDDWDTLVACALGRTSADDMGTDWSSPSIPSTATSHRGGTLRPLTGPASRRAAPATAPATPSAAAVGDERLARRREQVARASRILRARRKGELSYLRDENARLQTERAELMASVASLNERVASVAAAPEQDQESVIVNQLLKIQVAQHQLLRRSLLGSQVAAEDAASGGDVGVYRTISAQTVELAWNEALQLLAGSQRAAGWAPPVVIGPEACAPGVWAVVSHAQRAGGGCDMRVDVFVEGVAADAFPAQAVRDRYFETWTDEDTIKSAFAHAEPPALEQRCKYALSTVPEFSFDGDASSSSSSSSGADDALHVVAMHGQERFEATHLVRDWVFLCAARKRALGAGKLSCSAAVERARLEAMNEAEGAPSAAGGGAPAKRARPDGEDAVETFAAARTVTCHGPSASEGGGAGANALQEYACMSEAFFAWHEVVPSRRDPGADVTMGRATAVFSIPANTTPAVLGHVSDFFDANHNLSPRLREVVGNYLSTVVGSDVLLMLCEFSR